jgi:hypothetical protein
MSIYKHIHDIYCLDVCDIHVRDTCEQTTLHTAAWFSSSYQCEQLLQRGADIKLLDGWDCTPLHCATFTGSHDPYDICVVLLEYGVNINALTAYDQTALTYLCNYEDTACIFKRTVILLLNSGANPQLGVYAKTGDGTSQTHAILFAYGVPLDVLLIEDTKPDHEIYFAAICDGAFERRKYAIAWWFAIQTCVENGKKK